MAVVRFTRNIQRHVECPEHQATGASVREVLDSYFDLHPQARGYVLDDRNRLRQHMAVFVDGNQVLDRDALSDAVPSTAVLDIVQALSGGCK